MTYILDIFSLYHGDTHCYIQLDPFVDAKSQVPFLSKFFKITAHFAAISDKLLNHFCFYELIS